MVRRYLPAVLKYGILANLVAAVLPFSYLAATEPTPFVTLLTHVVRTASLLLILCSVLSLWSRSRWVDWPRLCALQALYIVSWAYWFQKLAWIVDVGFNATSTVGPFRVWSLLAAEIVLWTGLLVYNFHYRRLKALS